jgi:dehydrogenase/reductase SDR family protein 7B
MAEYLMGRRTTRVVLSARNESSLQSVADSLRASGVTDVLVVPLDLTALADDMELATAAVRQVEQRFGSVDVLVHNGGMSMRGESIATTLAVDVALLKCNYLGAVALTKAVLPGMVQRRSGSILAMSSVQGKLPIAFRSAYAASKHAMNAFFHSLRYEVRHTVRLCNGSDRRAVVAVGYLCASLTHVRHLCL